LGVHLLQQLIQLVGKLRPWVGRRKSSGQTHHFLGCHSHAWRSLVVQTHQAAPSAEQHGEGHHQTAQSCGCCCTALMPFNTNNARWSQHAKLSKTQEFRACRISLGLGQSGDEGGIVSW